MNEKQLSEHIGSIDDRLIWQAKKVPVYAEQHRQKRIQKLLAATGALLLMLFSFSVGAMVFSREIMIEVPVKQEILELEGVNLTLILPDSREGLYSVGRKGTVPRRTVSSVPSVMQTAEAVIPSFSRISNAGSTISARYSGLSKRFPDSALTTGFRSSSCQILPPPLRLPFPWG